MGFRFEVRDREGRSEGRGEVVDFDGPVRVGLEYLGVIDVGDLGKEVLGFAGLSGEWSLRGGMWSWRLFGGTSILSCLRPGKWAGIGFWILRGMSAVGGAGM